MPGRVDHGGVYALLEAAGSPPPNIATSAHAIVRHPRAAAPVEPECRPAPPAGRNPSPQPRRTAAAVLCASLLGLGLAFFACTLLIPALRLDWSDVVCLGGNSNPPQTARTDE